MFGENFFKMLFQRQIRRISVGVASVWICATKFRSCINGFYGARKIEDNLETWKVKMFRIPAVHSCVISSRDQFETDYDSKVVIEVMKVLNSSVIGLLSSKWLNKEEDWKERYFSWVLTPALNPKQWRKQTYNSRSVTPPELGKHSFHVMEVRNANKHRL